GDHAAHHLFNDLLFGSRAVFEDKIDAGGRGHVAEPDRRDGRAILRLARNEHRHSRSQPQPGYESELPSHTARWHHDGRAGGGFLAAPGGSFTLRIWSARTFSSCCSMPLGQRISTSFAVLSWPRPKCTRLSLAD